ncbi:hypothetical protein ACFQ08_09270, partial [Streptosporangium algeriense]
MLLPHRSRSALTALAYTLAALLAASGTQAMTAPAHATGGAHQAVTQAANAQCVRQGQHNYPVEYYWKNIIGVRLGNGNISVTTSPSLWGGQITPGGTFTLTLRHQTAKWPWVVRSYTTTWDISSLLANATVVSQSGTGSISGNTLSITSPGSKTDPAAKVITFRVKPGTV